MHADTAGAPDRRQAALIRLGGLAVLAGLAVHILVNFFLKTFPPENPTLEELKAYLSRESATWSLVHGLRYLAFPCIALFAGGLYTRTCRLRPAAPTGWGVVGVMGASILVTNAMMTNGIETLAFFDFERLSGNPELFWMLFHITRVLFTAEIVAWAVLFLGFSMAGWLSATLPRWIAGLGFLSATAGLVSGLFITSVLSEGPASIFMEIAALTGMAWFACTGIYMVIMGER